MQHLEHDNCVALNKILKGKGILFSKIVNELGSFRMPIQKIMWFKAEWLNAWVPDYVWIIPWKDWNKMFWIEMKKPKWGKTSLEQKQRIDAINDCKSVEAKVCNWVAEAMTFITDIMNKDA